MRIEIAEPGRMSQSGSSLLRLIQNNKTPVLDLLVRESIQNSLDAHKEDAKAVTVEYLTGTFSSYKLSDELEGISSALVSKFPSRNCQYLAVCDFNTVGLTGEMDVQNVKDNNYGNLLKLVYEICKPQEAEGAGGSWGLGKTVYFRIGIGLVIYYSRIDEGNGKYSSRLAASFVEDENSPIDEKYAEMILKVAPTHDLGKIAISDDILNKPGPLTKEEYDIIKTHPLKSADIIRTVFSDIMPNDLYQIALNIALYHHEKFDGSGYPFGLKGEDIPLEARIVAMADVYDALVSKRPYKNPYSFKEAADYMDSVSNSHFDQRLYPYFKKSLSEIEKNYQNN